MACAAGHNGVEEYTDGLGKNREGKRPKPTICVDCGVSNSGIKYLPSSMMPPIANNLPRLSISQMLPSLDKLLAERITEQTSTFCFAQLGFYRLLSASQHIPYIQIKLKRLKGR